MCLTKHCNACHHGPYEASSLTTLPSPTHQLIWNIDVNRKSIIFAETTEPRDEENEYLLQDMIRDGGDGDDFDQYLIDYGEGAEREADDSGEGVERENDGSGEGVEREDDGSGGRTITTTKKSGEVI